mmetsp:Transcript_85339/g.275429  ORF Transcript_85339/g.275429 Transcript_85339/m.275429 type:complete len:217 (+) Transcript_85339:206-856(+)
MHGQAFTIVAKKTTSWVLDLKRDELQNMASISDEPKNLLVRQLQRSAQNLGLILSHNSTPWRGPWVPLACTKVRQRALHLPHPELQLQARWNRVARLAHVSGIEEVVAREVAHLRRIAVQPLEHEERLPAGEPLPRAESRQPGVENVQVADCYAKALAFRGNLGVGNQISKKLNPSRPFSHGRNHPGTLAPSRCDESHECRSQCASNCGKEEASAR